LFYTFNLPLKVLNILQFGAEKNGFDQKRRNPNESSSKFAPPEDVSASPRLGSLYNIEESRRGKFATRNFDRSSLSSVFFIFFIFFLPYFFFSTMEYEYEEDAINLDGELIKEMNRAQHFRDRKGLALLFLLFFFLIFFATGNVRKTSNDATKPPRLALSSELVQTGTSSGGGPAPLACVSQCAEKEFETGRARRFLWFAATEEERLLVNTELNCNVPVRPSRRGETDFS
jgi:hypothetical protein